MRLLWLVYCFVMGGLVSAGLFFILKMHFSDQKLVILPDVLAVPASACMSLRDRDQF